MIPDAEVGATLRDDDIAARHLARARVRVRVGVGVRVRVLLHGGVEALRLERRVHGAAH